MSFAPRAAYLQHESELHRRRLAVRERADRERLVRPLSGAQRAAYLQRWEQTRQREGWSAATRELNFTVRPLVEAIERDVKPNRAARNAARIIAGDQLELWSSDPSVKTWAKRRADELATLMVNRESLPAAYDEACAYCERFGVEAQQLVGAMSMSAALARMASARWWRRRGRRWITTGVEARELDAGKVHRRAAVYVSDPSVRRAKDGAARNRQLLMDLHAVNELGDSFTLAELADKSTANMHLRFCEMIVRLRGLEAAAEREGYAGVFITWTLASRWHRKLAASGGDNPAYSGATPREGQAELCRQWASVRASLAKRGARYFGMRVAEPHHDGTPHWHALLFVKPEHEARLLDSIRAAALGESPDEAGAQQHRFRVERIDKAKGGATSYVAKYVSKMTTGAGLAAAVERGADGVQREVGPPSASANRARVWASVHRIRQFQFFGTPPVTVWRELRRLTDAVAYPGDAPPDQPLPMTPRTWRCIESARAMGRAGDYSRHAAALGGMAVPRSARPVEVWREETGEVNAYGEPVVALRGVKGAGAVVQGVAVPGLGSKLTRLHEWRIETRARDATNTTLPLGDSRQKDCTTGDGGIPSSSGGIGSMPPPARGSAAVDSERGGEAGAPWTRINNCSCRGIITTALGGADPPPKPPRQWIDTPEKRRYRHMIRKPQ